MNIIKGEIAFVKYPYRYMSLSFISSLYTRARIDYTSKKSNCEVALLIDVAAGYSEQCFNCMHSVLSLIEDLRIAAPEYFVGHL